MTTQERELLAAFLANLRTAKVVDADPEAQSMISHAVAAKPDAPYLLVQQALVQQAALSRAQNRIGDLEAQLRKSSADAASAGSGFLASAGWATPASSGAPAQPPAGGFAGAASGPAAMQPQPRSGMGDFLRGAATTAAGVAGGALLFEGIEHLLAGRHASGGFLGGDAPMGVVPEIVENTTIVNEFLGTDRASDPISVPLAGNDLFAQTADDPAPALLDEIGDIDNWSDDRDRSDWI